MADPALSVIVPFHAGLPQLQACLNGLMTAMARLDVSAEVIVIADTARDDPEPVARAAGVTVVRLEGGPDGPALARNRGAARARGDVLVFVDSDVVVDPEALAEVESFFGQHPDLAAVFGAYNETPAADGFVSRCKNLAHGFIHRRARGPATTFWAGLGAVRNTAFWEVGGFDERFRRPSVEDIDLGYRLTAAGRSIRLEPSIAGTHLKRWTLLGGIKSDLFDRGIPWTQLVHRYRDLPKTLNLSVQYRLCVVVSYLGVALLALAPIRPWLLLPAGVMFGALWWLDWSYYRYFLGKIGLSGTLRWFPVHVAHHLCNGIAFVVGTGLHVVRRWTGISLRGALPLDPWPKGAAAPPGQST